MWTLRQEERKRLEPVDMWMWQRLLNIIWGDGVSIEEVLRKVGEDGSLWKTTKKGSRGGKDSFCNTVKFKRCEWRLDDKLGWGRRINRVSGHWRDEMAIRILKCEKINLDDPWNKALVQTKMNQIIACKNWYTGIWMFPFEKIYHYDSYSLIL